MCSLTLRAKDCCWCFANETRKIQNGKKQEAWACWPSGLKKWNGVNSSIILTLGLTILTKACWWKGKARWFWKTPTKDCPAGMRYWYLWLLIRMKRWCWAILMTQEYCAPTASKKAWNYGRHEPLPWKTTAGSRCCGKIPPISLWQITTSAASMWARAMQMCLRLKPALQTLAVSLLHLSRPWD